MFRARTKCIRLSGKSFSLRDTLAISANVIFTHCSPHGDLHKLIKHYEALAKREERAGRQHDIHIPEPMIWCVAEALAIAGYVMEHGAMPLQPGQGPGNVTQDWFDIIHR